MTRAIVVMAHSFRGLFSIIVWILFKIILSNAIMCNSSWWPSWLWIIRGIGLILSQADPFIFTVVIPKVSSLANRHGCLRMRRVVYSSMHCSMSGTFNIKFVIYDIIALLTSEKRRAARRKNVIGFEFWLLHASSKADPMHSWTYDDISKSVLVKQ